MWSVQADKERNNKSNKVRVNFLLDESYRKRFKELCQKRGWIISTIVQNNIRRLVDGI